MPRAFAHKNMSKREVIKDWPVDPHRPTIYQGKWRDKVNIIDYLIPDEGRCRADMKAIERWRIILNVYVSAHRTQSPWRAKLSRYFYRYSLDVGNPASYQYPFIHQLDDWEDLDLGLLENFIEEAFAEAWHEFINFRDKGKRA